MTGSSTIRRLAAARQGQTMAEYGIILALIFLTAVVGVAMVATALGVSITDTVGRINTVL